MSVGVCVCGSLCVAAIVLAAAWGRLGGCILLVRARGCVCVGVCVCVGLCVWLPLFLLQLGAGLVGASCLCAGCQVWCGAAKFGARESKTPTMACAFGGCPRLL